MGPTLDNLENQGVTLAPFPQNLTLIKGPPVRESPETRKPSLRTTGAIWVHWRLFGGLWFEWVALQMAPFNSMF